MSVSGIRLYAETSLLLPLALAGLSVAWALLRSRETRAGRWARLAHLLLLAALLAPALTHLVPAPRRGIGPSLKIWSGGLENAGRISFAVAGHASDPAPDAGSLWSGSLGERTIGVVFFALLAASLFGVARLLVRMLRLRRHCASLAVWRRSGRLRICVSDADPAPFSAATVGAAFVVLPVALLAHPGRMRVALRHELEHVRRADTSWVYLAELACALLPWHPAAHAWSRLVSRLQEHACDQAVLGAGVTLEAYTDCLIAVSEMAARPRAVVLGLGLGSGRRGLLRRRIEMLVNGNGESSRWIVPTLGVLGLVMVSIVATTVRGAVADRRIVRAEAQAASAAVERRSGFPVTVDETVLEQLEGMVGAEAERARWRAALARAEELRPQIDPILRQHGLPSELAAVALVESGFRALPPDPAVPRRGAGVWQLIPETARHFGLRVDGASDERLDLARSTGAAARYLKELHAEFGDWPLAIAAYTHGSTKVREAVAREDSRDALGLERSKALTPYTSQVLAAVLLLERPDLVR